MAKENKNTYKKKRELSKEDIERLELLQKADEVKGEQLSINLDSELTVENQAVKLLGQTIDDPVEKFQLYYHGLSKLLKDNLPKGKENEQVRRIVYDENRKSTRLNSSHVRISYAVFCLKKKKSS